MNATRPVSEILTAQLIAPFPLAAPRPALVPAAIPGAPWSHAPVEVSVRIPHPELGATLAIARALEASGPLELSLPPRTAQTVPIENDSELLAVTQIWELEPGQCTLTVAVKGTFELVADHPAVLSASAEYPLGDQYVDDDPTKSLLRASDYAVFKPRADVTLVGTAYAREPGARRSEVRFMFGKGKAGFDRVLAIFGERILEPRPTGDVIRRPEPFDALALRYEEAFGGVGFGKNPVGTGYCEHPVVVRMPRIEDPAALISAGSDRREPAGFGPIALAWEPRRGALGSFDEAWLRERWPFFPADFDPVFFQVAPREQQIAHLQGDERFRIEGMHPQHPVLEGRLPRVRARICVQRTPIEGEDQRAGFREQDTVLDTVHFDVDAMRLDLVWRTHFQVHDTAASDLTAVFVTSEPIDTEPAGEDSLYHRFVVMHGRPAEPPGGEAANDAAELDDVAATLDQAAERRQRSIEGAELPQGSAIPAPAIPPPVIPAPAISPQRTRVEAMLKEGRSLAGANLSDADLSRLDLSRVDLTQANLQGALLRGALLRAADLTGAQLSAANLCDADLTSAHLDGADLTDAVLDRARFDAATLERTVFDGSSGLDCRFHDVEAPNSSFVGVTLRACRFVGAKLDGADFSEAQLEAAVFDGASLCDAKFYDARAVASSWLGCNLTDLRAEGAVFDGAHLDGVRGPRSMWEGAVLDGAVFDRAKLDGASFVRISARLARFAGASLVEARFKDATLGEAVFADANLMRASFGGADLTGADFSGANLFSAETWRVALAGARFDGAMLAGTKLSSVPRIAEKDS